LNGAGQRAAPDTGPVASVPDTAARDAAKEAARLASSTTLGYAQGHQARLEYEQWFAALSDGAYKDGVLFWVNNRSLKPAPTCAYQGGTEDWQAGCLMGRGRLSVIDLRRGTAKDFWWGWNSL
jgi:hypothetical protein